MGQTKDCAGPETHPVLRSREMERETCWLVPARKTKNEALQNSADLI